MLKRIWRDPVWSAVIATGIISGIVWVGVSFPEYFSAIALWLSGLWAFILASSSVPNWLLGIGSFLALSTVIRIAVLMLSSGSEYSVTPSWRGYRKDSFFGVIWAWDYGSDGQLVKVHSLCPRCQCQIVPRYEERWSIGTYYHFECDACGYKGEEVKGVYEEIVNKVVRFAQRKIRTGEWEHVAL